MEKEGSSSGYYVSFVPRAVEVERGGAFLKVRDRDWLIIGNLPFVLDKTRAELEDFESDAKAWGMEKALKGYENQVPFLSIAPLERFPDLFKEIVKVHGPKVVETPFPYEVRGNGGCSISTNV